MATWPTITDDDGTGTTGTILDQALFNSVRDYIGGAWTSVTFAAGNFTANGSMTWTVASGDQNTYKYVVCGKTMHVAWRIDTSSVGGTPSTELRIAIPGGATATGGTVYTPFTYSDNASALAIGYAQVVGGTTYISLYKVPAANWTAATDTTQVFGSIAFEIT